MQNGRQLRGGGRSFGGQSSGEPQTPGRGSKPQLTWPRRGSSPHPPEWSPHTKRLSQSDALAQPCTSLVTYAKHVS